MLECLSGDIPQKDPFFDTMSVSSQTSVSCSNRIQWGPHRELPEWRWSYAVPVRTSTSETSCNLTTIQKLPRMRFCVKSIPRKSSITILALRLFKMPRELDVSFAGRFGHIIVTSGHENLPATYPTPIILHVMERMHVRVGYIKGRCTSLFTNPSTSGHPRALD